MATNTPSYKNVVVLGGSYVGQSIAKELVGKLPEGHRVVVVERNSHFGHLWVSTSFSA